MGHVQGIPAKPYVPTQANRGKQVQRVVNVMVAWKALLPGEVANTVAVKMADEAMKHLTMSTSGGPSGTTSSTATQSQVESGMDKKNPQMVVNEPLEPSSLETTGPWNEDEKDDEEEEFDEPTSTSDSQGHWNE
ncbi:hypothetical protein Sjap_002328 [Stephania japonica]|uniref:Uncharacterized protein n=1 Tax=Stephania japonica TaxID=461633 RepID=A0AAP0KNA0_9MAGN